MLQAVVAVVVIYSVVAALHVLLPATEIEGYACDRRGKPLKYRINGLAVTGIAAFLQLTGVVYPVNFVYENFWSMCFAANIIGLSLSYLFYYIGKKDPEIHARCLTKDSPDPIPPSKEEVEAFEKWTTWDRFYLGMEFNPRKETGVVGIGLDFDWKMYCYLVGAIMLEMVVLSTGVAHTLINNGHLSNAMVVNMLMWNWFIIEYIYHEHVHLFTYDLFAERFGFKLCWGCFTFYPFFYALGLRSMVTPFGEDDDVSVGTGIFLLCIFLVGWCFTRGANNQKYIFKIDPKQKFLGLIEPKYIEVPRPGKSKPRLLLTSGFWGLARHVNYLGEIIQSIAISLPGFLTTGSLVPFLYPIFITTLMVTRQIDDDAICARKYGDKWNDYKRLVPSRIIPWVY